MSDAQNDRVRCLDTAKGYVTKDRNTSYGTPEDNFGNIAGIWNAQLSHKLSAPLTSADVALLMIGMKLARLKHNPEHEDSWIDSAGYAACGMEIALGGQRLNTPQPEPDGLELHKDRADVSELVERQAAEGWISDNRCGTANPHEPHPYGNHGPGHDLPAYWCDGYVSGHRERVARDVDAVKRVADNQALRTMREAGTL